MIILKVHVGDGIALKPESNPPVACYIDAVFAFPITFKRMKLPTWHSRHLREVVGKLQGGQDGLDLPDRVGRYAAQVVIFVKASETFVPELPDGHDGLYGITVRLSSYYRPVLCWASQSQVHPFPLGFRLWYKRASGFTPMIEKVYPLTEGIEAVGHAARPGTRKVLLRP